MLHGVNGLTPLKRAQKREKAKSFPLAFSFWIRPRESSLSSIASQLAFPERPFSRAPAQAIISNETPSRRSNDSDSLSLAPPPSTAHTPKLTLSIQERQNHVKVFSADIENFYGYGQPP